MNLLKRRGHCGFRAVVGLHDMFVDDYQITRYQFHKKLIIEETECYRRLIGSDNHFIEVLYALTGDGIGPAPRNKWMIMLDMGFLIAQRYKHVVVLLSIKKGRSEYFFALCDVPCNTLNPSCYFKI